MKTKKKSGKTLRKSGKSQGKIREFDGIKKVGTLTQSLLVFLDICMEMGKTFKFRNINSYVCITSFSSRQAADLTATDPGTGCGSREAASGPRTTTEWSAQT